MWQIATELPFMVKLARRTRTRAPLILVVIVVVTAAVVYGVESARNPPTPATGPPIGHGKWKLVFDSEFNGTQLNRTVWNPHDGWSGQNNVTDHLVNVDVKNGHVILSLASPSSGAAIATNHFRMRVGEYAEARIKFAGDGRTIYNWPAWWASGPNWPAGGENDIAEGFGSLTVNYHSPSVTRLLGPVPGDWAGRFHTYGLYRGRLYSRVYWDGKLVRSYRTADDGQPETLVLTIGAANQIKTGPAGAMIVDFVRVWAPG